MLAGALVLACLPRTGHAAAPDDACPPPELASFVATCEHSGGELATYGSVDAPEEGQGPVVLPLRTQEVRIPISVLLRDVGTEFRLRWFARPPDVCRDLAPSGVTEVFQPVDPSEAGTRRKTHLTLPFALSDLPSQPYPSSGEVPGCLVLESAGRRASRPLPAQVRPLVLPVETLGPPHNTPITQGSRSSIVARITSRKALQALRRWEAAGRGLTVRSQQVLTRDPEVRVRVRDQFEGQAARAVSVEVLDNGGIRATWPPVCDDRPACSGQFDLGLSLGTPDGWIGLSNAPVARYYVAPPFPYAWLVVVLLALAGCAALWLGRFPEAGDLGWLVADTGRAGRALQQSSRFLRPRGSIPGDALFDAEATPGDRILLSLQRSGRLVAQGTGGIQARLPSGVRVTPHGPVPKGAQLTAALGDREVTVDLTWKGRTSSPEGGALA